MAGQQALAPGCPAFGNNTLLAGPEHEAVRPVLHAPQCGRYEVVWWDPSALRLGVEAKQSLRTLDRFQGDGSVGTGAYRPWEQRRAESIQKGSQPAWQVWDPSEMRDAPDGEAILVERLVVEDRPPRPSGPRFGTLVHAVFREVAWSGEGVPGLT